MIQRIQSLFLLGVIAAGILLFYFPLLSYSVSNNENGVLRQFLIPDNFYLNLLTVSIIIVAAISISQFKNRMRQVKFCGFNMLLATILLIAIFYVEGKLIDGEVKVKYETGIYLILLILVFLWAAIRFIRKDEEMVRSAERLR